MKGLSISKLKPLDGGQYSFAVIADNFGVVPGFRLYGGKIQAPARKFKSSWYPMLYLTEEVASSVYREVAAALPTNAVLLPEEKALQDLVVNAGVEEKLKI